MWRAGVGRQRSEREREREWKLAGGSSAARGEREREKKEKMKRLNENGRERREEAVRELRLPQRSWPVVSRRSRSGWRTRGARTSGWQPARRQVTVWPAEDSNNATGGAKNSTAKKKKKKKAALDVSFLSLLHLPAFYLFSCLFIYSFYQMDLLPVSQQGLLHQTPPTAGILPDQEEKLRINTTCLLITINTAFGVSP